jgi:hypothetical protein
VAAEAMLNGIPVLTSNRGALPETIGAAGFLLDIPARYTPETRELPTAEEVAPWVETIIHLWDDAAEYDRWSRAAREHAQQWHPDRLAPIYREFFGRITHSSTLVSAGLRAKPAERVNAGTASADDPRERWGNRISWLCELPDEELAKVDIAALNLACAELLPGSEGVDFTACRRKLDEWARLVQLNTEHWWANFAATPEKFNHSRNRFRMAALVTVLQRHLGVKYYMPFSEGEYNATDSRNLFIHGPMNGHGGTCVTMPVLYIAVGRRLGYPLKLVEAYQHLFARWDEPGGERFNIECTCNGFSACDDDHYLSKPKPIPAELLNRGIYLRSLGPREELAEFLIQRGKCLIDNLRFCEAEAAGRYAARLAPDHVNADWPIASLLRIAIEEAQARARSRGRPTIDLGDLRFPNEKAWQRDLAAHARECLDRILRIHAQKKAAATSRFFGQLAREDCHEDNLKEVTDLLRRGEISCTIRV